MMVKPSPKEAGSSDASLGAAETEPQTGMRFLTAGSAWRYCGARTRLLHQPAAAQALYLVAEEVARFGGREVSILPQDYGQELLAPLPGRGLLVGGPEPIADSSAGKAFLTATTVEVAQADGVRMYLPMLDGSDQVGVMALTLDTVVDDRRPLRRLVGLVSRHDRHQAQNHGAGEYGLTAGIGEKPDGDHENSPHCLPGVVPGPESPTCPVTMVTAVTDVARPGPTACLLRNRRNRSPDSWPGAAVAEGGDALIVLRVEQQPPLLFLDARTALPAG